MNLDPEITHETTHGRRIEALRWHQGRLQVQVSEKYERYERGRFLCGGTRIIWEDVPGAMPGATLSALQPDPAP